MNSRAATFCKASARAFCKERGVPFSKRVYRTTKRFYTKTPWRLRHMLREQSI